MQPEIAEAIEKVLATRYDKYMEWKGNREQIWGGAESQVLSRGHKQWYNSAPHHLFMIDLVTAMDFEGEANPNTDRVEAADHENLVDDQGMQGLWKTVYGVEEKEPDVWNDAICLTLLKEGVLPDGVTREECKRARKRATHYYWKEQKLFFKDLYVPRPEERRILVVQMHEDLGHSGEQRLLVEICRRCGVQASTRFSPFMVLTGRSPRLRADNYLSALTDVVNDEVEVEQIASQFLEKVKLIASIHENILLNIEQAQKKQRSTYASRAGKHLFEGLIAGETMVKMKKPSKKRALAASWEGPYQFIGHVDGKGNYDFEEGS
ncbi:unnamed protein product [Sphagnum jensenii]|uniref:Integrase zinc-binding domain-containing protein n=1 Tax=Sphagnum jensenii TaxID=128206 RepID=A0ABP1C014_9BRYO